MKSFAKGAACAVATVILLFLAGCLAGCVHTEVQLPGGAKFSRTSFLSNATVGDVTVKMNGPDAGVKIDSYNGNQTEVAAAAVGLANAVLKK